MPIWVAAGIAVFSFFVGIGVTFVLFGWVFDRQDRVAQRLHGCDAHTAGLGWPFR